MAQVIYIEDKDTTVEFPDGTPPNVMEAAIRRNLYTPEEQGQFTTFSERESYRWRKGEFVVQRGNIGDQVRRGQISFEKARIRIEVIGKEFTPDNDIRFQAQNLSEKFAGATTELVPYMGTSIAEGLKTASITASVGAGLVATAGLIPPLTAVPEEIVTVPGAALAFGAVGMAFGIWNNASNIEGGNIYLDLIQGGIDPKSAANWSSGAGAMIGAIEVLQVGQLFNRFIPGGTKVAKNLLVGFMIRQFAKPSAPFGKFAAVSARLTTEVAKRTGLELAEEEAQEIVTLAAEAGAHLNEAMAKDQGYEGPTFDESSERLKQVFLQGIFGFPLLGLPGSVATTISQTRVVNQLVTEKGKETLLGDTLREIIDEAKTFDISERDRFHEEVDLEISRADANTLGFDNKTLLMDALFEQAQREKIVEAREIEAREVERLEEFQRPVVVPGVTAEIQERINDFRTNIDRADMIDPLTGEIAPEALEDVEFITNNFERFDNAYDEEVKREFKTDTPNIISADIARTLDIEGRETFTQGLSTVRQGAASAFAKTKLDILLRNPETRRMGIVTLAGISGAGKTQSIARTGFDNRHFAAVLDTNLSSIESARRFINRGLEEDRQVVVYFVDRDPIVAFEQGVFPRFQRTKRIVTIPVHVKNMRSRVVIEQAFREFGDNDNIQFVFIDNRQATIEQAKVVRFDELKPITQTAEGVTNGLRRFIQERFEAGEITESELQTFLGELVRPPTRPPVGRRPGIEVGEPRPPADENLVREKVIREVGLTEAEREAFPALAAVEDRIRSLRTEITEAETDEARRELRARVREELETLRIARIARPPVPPVKPKRKVTITELALLREKIKALNVGFRTGEKITKAMVKSVQTEIIRTLQESDLSRGDKAKFITTIKNIQTFPQLEKAFPEIRERIAVLEEKAAVKDLKNKIRKALEGAKVRKVAGKPLSRFGADAQAMLDFINQTIKLDSFEAAQILDENIEKLDGTTILTPTELFQNKTLSMAAGEATSEDMRTILNAINAIKEGGAAMRKAELLAESAQLDEDRQAALKVIRGNKASQAVTPGRIRNADERFSTAFKQFGKTISGWDNLLDMLSYNDKGSTINKSELNKRLKVSEIEQLEKGAIRVQMDALVEGIQDIFGFNKKLFQTKENQMIKKFRDDAVRRDLGTFTDRKGNKIPLELSVAEARKVFMELQDPTLKETFEEAMGYTEAMKKAVIDSLSAKDKKMALFELAFYRKFYNERANPAYREAYGINLPFNDFYSPIRRIGVALKDNESEFLKDAQYRRSVAPRSFKSRVPNLKKLQIQSDISVLQTHIMEMEHFIVWHKKIRQLNAVFNDRVIRDTISEFHGTKIQRVTDDFIKNFTDGGRDRGQVIKAVDFVRVGFTRAVLSIKGVIFFKQLASIPAYADDLPAPVFAKNFALFFLDPVKNTKILVENSELLKARAKGITRDIKDSMRAEEFSAFRKKPTFLNSLLFLTKMGDRGAIVAGGWTIFKAEIDNGRTQEEAIKRFEEVTQAAQQSADISQLSFWQRKGSLAKMFTMFTSAQNQYFRKEVSAIRNLFAGRVTFPKASKTIFIYHFLLPMVFQWISDFGRWDKKEQLRAAILGSFNGVFILNDMLDSLIRSILGLRVFSSELPPLTVTRGVMKAIGKVRKEDFDFVDDWVEPVKDISETVGALAGGIPLKQLFNMGEGISDIQEGEVNKGILRLLGWSTWSIEKGFESKAKRKFKLVL